jgi:alpha-L-glutamate ligase-like protein
MIGRYRKLKQAGVLGLNARNGNYILKHNQRRLYPLVDNKIRCKEVLRAHGIAVPELLDSIESQHEVGQLARRLEPLNEFVIKPASGSGGDGIILISGKQGDHWISSGKVLSLADLQFHISGILNGVFSLAGQVDSAMVEALVRPAPELRQLAPEGVPDIRVVVYRGIPVMAMMRLPTRHSGGCANLHRGAIGVGIDMLTGRTQHAVMNDRVVRQHPDSYAEVQDFAVPKWSQLVELAARCQMAVGLGYLGVDIVVDARRGPLVLELNARPGLAIQIANQAGQERRLRAVDRIEVPETASLESRLAYMQELASAHWATGG